MTELVVDASVAVKWVVPEVGATEAVLLLDRHSLTAPDLATAECANILWKKSIRGEINEQEALLACRLLQQADWEILPTRHLFVRATQIAIQLNHPAYDCLYLALAESLGQTFITADEKLVNKVGKSAMTFLNVRTVSLGDIPADL